MSREIDSRVVEMQFDNGRFEKNAQTTIGTIDKLKESLNFEKVSKSFYDVNNAVHTVDLSAIEQGLASLEQRFSTLGIVGMTVINRLTNGLISIATRLGHQIVSGGLDRALKIQQAQFLIEGLHKDWNKLSEDINESVKGTSYGFDSAAMAAAQFSASGVKAGEDMQQALRGVAGVASMTGSSYDEISNIFTTIAGNGKLMTQQLRQFSFRGMNMAAELGKQMGKTEAQIYEMVSKGQISFEEFAVAMDKAFGAHAKEVQKTFRGAIGATTANLSRLGAVLWEPLVKTREWAKDNEHLVKGQENLVDIILAFKEAFGAVENMLKYSKGLKVYEKTIHSVSASISEFINSFIKMRTYIDGKGKKKEATTLTNGFKLSKQEAEDLKNAISGLTAILDLFKRVLLSVKDILSPITSLFKSVVSMVLAFAGMIGVTISGLSKTTKEAVIFSKTFEILKAVMKSLISIVSALTDGFTSLFRGMSGGIIERMDAILKRIQAWNKRLDSMDLTIAKSIRKIAKSISTGIKQLFDAISSGALNRSFDKIFDFLNSGLLVAIGSGIYKFIDNLSHITKTADNVVSGIKVIFDGVTECLSSLQANVNAGTLIIIASAISMLAFSLLMLSSIDSEKLSMGLMALSIIFYELYFILGKFLDKLGAGDRKGRQKIKIALANLWSLTKSLVLLSVAVLIFAAAVKVLGSMSWEELLVGLVGLSAILFAIHKFVNAQKSMDVKLTKIAASMIVLGIALNVMVAAVYLLSRMTSNELIKGITAITFLLLSLAAFLKILEEVKGTEASITKLLALAVALDLMVIPIRVLSKMSPEELAKGIVSITVLMFALAAAMRILSEMKAAKGAAGMLAMAVALNMIMPIIRQFSEMDPQKLGISIGAVAGLILALATAMAVAGSGATLRGAIGFLAIAGALKLIVEPIKQLGELSAGVLVRAIGTIMALSASLGKGGPQMIIMAAAIAILAPALKMLGDMTKKEIAKGLIALAGAFVIFFVATVALVTLVGPLLAVSAAMALFGVAVLGIGTGVMLFASGIAILAGLTVTSLKSLTVSLTAIAATIPEFMHQIGAGLVEIFKAVKNDLPQIVELGMDILIAFFEGLEENITEITTIAVSIIAKFITAISANLKIIIDAGFNLMISFINGMAEALNENGEKLGEAIKNLILSIVAAIIDVLAEVLSVIPFVGEDIEKSLDNAADQVRSNQTLPDAAKKKGKETKEALDEGLTSTTGAEKAGGTSAEWYSKGISEKKQLVSHRAKDLANVTDKETQKSKAYLETNGKNAALGFANGLGSMMDSIRETARRMAREAKKSSAKELDEKSPSKAFFEIGAFATEGFVLGLASMNSKVARTGSSVADEAIDAVSGAISLLGDRYEALDELNPTITPVVDLSNVTAGAREIGNIFTGSTINPLLNGSITQNTTTSDIVSAINNLTFKMEAMEASFEANNIDPNEIYAAVRAGASNANVGVQLNNRELSRELRGMGVSFA